MFNLDMFKKNCRQLQNKTIRWLAQRPVLTLALIIAIGVVLLPAIMISILTPIAVLFNYIGIVTTTGGIGAVYDILFKGFLLALLFVGLLVTGFFVATCVGLMHSYKLFSALTFRTKHN